jgi:hypothetical protein
MKLRQKSPLALCVFYVLGVIGLAASLHFSGNNLFSIGLANSAKCRVCAGDKKIAKAGHCYKAASAGVKVKDSVQVEDKLSLPKNYSISEFLGPIISQFISALFPRTFTMIARKAPALAAGQAVAILHCVIQ